MNEKLILETLANLTKASADLQYALAGLTALVESRLPGISPEQKAMLRNEIEKQKKDAETLRRSVEPLQEALKKL